MLLVQGENHIEGAVELEEFNLHTVTDALKHHPAFRNNDSVEKLRVFGQRQIFVIWSYWHIWERLNQYHSTLQEMPGFTLAAALVEDYLSQQSIKIKPHSATTVNSSQFACPVDTSPSNSPYYNFWQELELDFMPLDMLKAWLKQSKHPSPSLACLNFPPYLSNLVRYTLDATLDLLPHELAANLYVSGESMLWSEFGSFVYYPNPPSCQFRQTETEVIAASSRLLKATALRLAKELCQAEEDWQDVNFAAKRTLKTHLNFWDGVGKEIKYHEILNLSLKPNSFYQF